jgi:phosphoribosylaminoimidazole carboxylase PurE protein
MAKKRQASETGKSSRGAAAVGRSAARGKPLVGVLYGSTSDESIVKECVQVLDRFEIAYETALLSAHRMPERTAEYARSARRRGLRVIICAAGMAAHLPGVVASLTTLPVIGVPLCGSALEGIDALFSMIQMPAGVPVATLAVGKAGAKNAALLATQILALSNSALTRRLDDLKTRLERGEKL